MRQFILKSKGFTLVELLIVLAIIAVLSGMAFPAYQSHLVKARRTDGQTALFHLAAAMEKAAIKNHGYQNLTLQALNIKPDSPHGYYYLRILRAEAADFLIAAEPLKSQRKDTACGTLAMNDKGERGRLLNNQLIIDKQCY